MTYTEGILGDGAAILKDGIMVPIEEVVARLNDMERHQEALIGLVGGCNEFRADCGRSVAYTQKIEKPLFSAQSLLAR